MKLPKPKKRKIGPAQRTKFDLAMKNSVLISALYEILLMRPDVGTLPIGIVWMSDLIAIKKIARSALDRTGVKYE